MGITDKFNNFNIKKTDRISQDDRSWLIRREELYRKAIAVNKAVYDMYKAANQEYKKQDLEEYRYSELLIGDFNVPERIDKIQKSYVDGIYSYFSRKYNVNLENNYEMEKIKSLYMNYSREKIKDLIINFVDYNVVMEKIFDQLGGLSFEEKAKQEIKDKIKARSYNNYRGEWQIKIKGKKFIYTGGYCSTSWDGEIRFNSVEWLNAILSALSYNTYGLNMVIDSLSKLYGYYDIRLTDQDIQEGFSAPEVGVEHIKFYKNGRVDITFRSGEFCRDFAREWCGYTLV